MKKQLYNIFFLFTALCMAACVEDEGNYDYEDVNNVLPVEIDGLEDAISVKQGSTLRLSPTLINDDASRYTYQWIVTEALTAGALPKRYEISDKKDLEYDVKLEPNSYLLNFIVTDKARDIYKRKEIKMTVSASPTNEGWYILKNDGNEVDFDYINADRTVYRDVLLSSGMRMQGKALDMTYQKERYYHVVYDAEGTATTLSNQSVFYIVTDQDCRTYNSKTMGLFKTFDDMFYEAPATKNPQSVYYTSSGNMFLMNANRIFYIYGMTMNIGKLTPKVGLNTFYPKIIPGGYQEVIVFDMEEHTFYKASSINGTVSAVGDVLLESGETVSFTNMPYSIQCIGENGSMGYYGYSYALMKNDDTGEGALARVKYGSSTFLSLKHVEKDDKLMEASVIAPSFVADFLYFPIANKVYSYENAEGLDDKEKLVAEYPEDETVVDLKHCYWKNTAYTSYLAANSLWVLTNSSRGWKLYHYDLIGESNPEINPEPVEVFKGTGEGRKILFRIF